MACGLTPSSERSASLYLEEEKPGRPLLQNDFEPDSAKTPYGHDARGAQ